MVSLVLPFGSDMELREQYKNVWGQVRVGKLLEDIDALAGNVAYTHCDDADPTTPPLTLVTAAVDRIDLVRAIPPDTDLRLRGCVTHVGRSSMNIDIDLTTCPEADARRARLAAGSHPGEDSESDAEERARRSKQGFEHLLEDMSGKHDGLGTPSSHQSAHASLPQTGGGNAVGTTGGENESGGSFAGQNGLSSDAGGVTDMPRLLARTSFTFVARDKENNAAEVPRLEAAGTGARREQEARWMAEGEARATKRKESRSKSLLVSSPTAQELELLHGLYLKYSRPHQQAGAVGQAPREVSADGCEASGAGARQGLYQDDRGNKWLFSDSTELRSVQVTMPQDRNIHGKVFGGYLMRKAHELAWSAAYSYAG